MIHLHITLSWCNWDSSCNSRNVRLACVELWKGLLNFLIAYFSPVRLSVTELQKHRHLNQQKCIYSCVFNSHFFKLIWIGQLWYIQRFKHTLCYNANWGARMTEWYPRAFHNSSGNTMYPMAELVAVIQHASNNRNSSAVQLVYEWLHQDTQCY